MSSTTVEKLRVRYGETDAMGHAYYGSYLLWFEQARGAWCRDRGFTYKQFEEMGLMLPVVELHVRYRAEIKYDELVSIHVKAAEIKRASIKFEYEVFRADGVKATEGYSWHVVMSATARRAITLPDNVRAMLERDPATVATVLD